MSMAFYIFMGLSSLTQVVLGAYVWRSQRPKIEAEATQTTAKAFDTLVGTLTKVSTDLSTTLMKSIDGINSREEKINKLEDENRQLGTDIKELRGQLNDATNANVQRDNRIELMQSSIDTMGLANSNLAQETVDLKVRVLGVEDENKRLREENHQKDETIKERDKTISELETRVKHLEQEVELLKKPVAVVVEEKLVEPKTET